MGQGHSGGGAAAEAGSVYQNRVAAWLCVQILAETHVSAPWDLPSQITLDSIRCEIPLPVDDVLVSNSEAGHGFIQAKHCVGLETSSSSDLASAFDQFVRLFLETRKNEHTSDPTRDPLDLARDRLVLAIGPQSSAPITRDLRAVLSRLRSIPPSVSINDIPTNAAQRKAFDLVTEHTRRSWQRNASGQPSDADLRALLSLIWIHELDVDAGGVAEREAHAVLRTTVLVEPSQADLAWNTLITKCGQFASDHAGADRQQLQAMLLGAGIPIKATPSYRQDTAKLKEYSNSVSSLLSDLSSIRVGPNKVKISRASTTALRNASEHGSLVVVSDPGAGKSGALFDLARMLRNDGADVILLVADRIEATSAALLRDEIGLQHDLGNVVENWPGTRPGYVIIDALDAARSENSQKTLRDLIFHVMTRTTRWKVIASIRKYDLRYASDLRTAFSGSPPTELNDSEFLDVRHLRIPVFDDQELEEISQQSTDLQRLISEAGGELRSLLRVPFNLRLTADLINAGISVDEITPIRTQVELLERYWQERIIRADSRGDAREAVLRLAVQGMVANRSLLVNRAHVASDPAVGASLNEVLSAHVLDEWQRPTGRRPERSVLTFSHHILYDYAVARLMLRGVPRTAAAQIVSDPDLSIAIRPSLVLHFQYLWWVDQGRTAFWDEVFDFLRTEGIPEIGKVVGPTVAADQATQVADLAPLIGALSGTDPHGTETADQALRHLVSGILA